MNETMYLVFNRTFELGATLLYAVCLTLFFRPFLPRQGRPRKLLILFSAYLIVDLLCGQICIPQGMSGLFRTVTLMAISGLLNLEKAMALLLAILYWSVRISSALMAESLYFIADRHWPLQAERPDTVFLRSVVLLMSLLLLHAVLLLVMLYVLQRQLKRRPLALHWQELCYISLLPTAGILFGQMISLLLFEPQDGILVQLYDRYPSFLAIVPLLALLFYTGSYLTILFQQGMAAMQEEKAACFIERQQTQAIQERIHEMERFYTHIRRLKHEMRGHMNTIKGLARNGKYADLEDYITQMNDRMDDFDLTLQTGNPVTDIIISDKQKKCREEGIRFQADFHYPDTGAYDSFDMGIILQNLLQNSLEACEKSSDDDRFISLTGKRKGHFFLIEVTNPYADEVIWGPDGLPATTKRDDTPMHGIGLSNVRRTAEKYLGGMEINLDGQLFQVTVMIQEQV